MLEIASDQGVIKFSRLKPRQSTLFLNTDGLRGKPRGPVGKSDVPHLPRSHESVEGVDRFLDGGVGIELMNKIDINVIRAEAPQAFVR